jgi:hypothetical protein
MTARPAECKARARERRGGADFAAASCAVRGFNQDASQAQTNAKLAFTSVYFSDSGLFKRLRPIQVRKTRPPLHLAPRVVVRQVFKHPRLLRAQPPATR